MALRLWLVRHGQSAGNVAARGRVAAGEHLIGLEMRDMDAAERARPRSGGGARPLVRGQPEAERPEVVISSPYLRARQTADAICARRRRARGGKGR